jgi:hypothetical protein
MSVASKQYLQKYGLLNGGNSSLRRHSPTTYRGLTCEPSSSLKEPERSYSSILYNYHNQNHSPHNYQKRERREAERDENILDMESLRRLPKLT